MAELRVSQYPNRTMHARILHWKRKKHFLLNIFNHLLATCQNLFSKLQNAHAANTCCTQSLACRLSRLLQGKCSPPFLQMVSRATPCPSVHYGNLNISLFICLFIYYSGLEYEKKSSGNLSATGLGILTAWQSSAVVKRKEGKADKVLQLCCVCLDVTCYG